MNFLLPRCLGPRLPNFPTCSLRVEWVSHPGQRMAPSRRRQKNPTAGHRGPDAGQVASDLPPTHHSDPEPQITGLEPILSRLLRPGAAVLEPWEIQGSIPGVTLFPRTGTGRARPRPGSPSWPETLSGSPGLTSLPWTKAHCRNPPLIGLPPWLDRASSGHCPALPSGDGRSLFCPQPSLLPNKRTRRAVSGLQGLMGSAAKR